MSGGPALGARRRCRTRVVVAQRVGHQGDFARCAETEEVLTQVRWVRTNSRRSEGSMSRSLGPVKGWVASGSNTSPCVVFGRGLCDDAEWQQCEGGKSSDRRRQQRGQFV